jgi:hypothetical protein
MTPREIVALLHAEIAARSPEHAALVAAWDAMRAAARLPDAAAPVPRPGSAAVVAYRQDRVRAYRDMLGQGLTPEQAAERLGISPRTAETYGLGWVNL